MTEHRVIAVVFALLACACSSDDSSPSADGGISGFQVGPGPSGGNGGMSSGTGGVAASGGTGGMSSGAGGTGGAGPTGGSTETTDAMVEETGGGDPTVDAGVLRPFQSIGWPTDDAVVEVDAMGAFGTDVSGITYVPGTLWLSMNLAPSKLYKMEKSGAAWQRVTSDGWSDGKELLFPDGVGVPDAEGVTLGPSDSELIYIGSERNLQGANGGTSRSSVLSYDTSSAGLALTAAQEWNLTASLPSASANQGVEAVTWIPDAQLDGFYAPGDYPTHGTGLFVVGMESQSDLCFFALGSDGAVDLIATIATELQGVMGIEYDASTGYLWAYCDDTCGNRAEILSLLPDGGFARRASVSPPLTLPDINNEGIAIAPDSECEGGKKAFYWVEDGNTNGHVLRVGTVPCGAFLETL